MSWLRVKHNHSLKSASTSSYQLLTFCLTLWKLTIQDIVHAKAVKKLLNVIWHIKWNLDKLSREVKILVKYAWEFQSISIGKAKSFWVISAAERMKESKRTWQFTVRKTAHDIIKIKYPWRVLRTNLPICT